AVAAVFLGGLVGGDLHRREDLARQLAAADRIERDGSAGLHQRGGEVIHKSRRGGVDDVLAADLPEDIGLLLAAYDIDEADAVLDADLVEHLAEIGGGRGV